MANSFIEALAAFFILFPIICASTALDQTGAKSASSMVLAGYSVSIGLAVLEFSTYAGEMSFASWVESTYDLGFAARRDLVLEYDLGLSRAMYVFPLARLFFWLPAWGL